MRILAIALVGTLLIAALLGFLALLGGGTLLIWDGLTGGDAKTLLGGLALIYFLFIAE